MNSTTKKLMLALALLLILHTTKAQEVWTLEKCIGYAIENNISIKQQELMVKSEKNTVIKSRMTTLPSVNGSVSHNYSFGRVVDPYTNDFINTNVRSNNFSVNASMTLFGGLQNYNTIVKSNLDFMSSLQHLEEIKNNISLNIASAYLQVLFAEENLTVVTSQLEVTKRQVERTQKLTDAGSLAKGDLLEIEAQYATEELALINAQNQLDISYLGLAQLLDLRSAENISIDRPTLTDNQNDESLALSVEMIFLEAQGLPQIKSAEYSLASANRSLMIARGGRSPRLTLSGGWGTGYSDARMLYKNVGMQEMPIGYLQTDASQLVYTQAPVNEASEYSFNDQFRDNSNMALSLHLSIPIFNGWQTQTYVSNSKIQVQSQQYTVELAKTQLYKEVQQAHNAAKAARSKYEGSKKAYAAMAEAFRYTEQKAELKMINSVDYNMAKNQLMSAESDMLQAKYQYIFNLKVLDFYRGRSITL